MDEIVNQISDSEIEDLFYKAINKWASIDMFVLAMLANCKISILPEEEYKTFCGLSKDKSGTMCTDGIEIYASMLFIRSLGLCDSTGEKITDINKAKDYILCRTLFTLAHEVYHIVNKHIFRAKNARHHHALSNITQDAIINESILSALKDFECSIENLMTKSKEYFEKYKPVWLSSNDGSSDDYGMHSIICEDDLIQYFKDQYSVELPSDISKANYEYIYGYVHGELIKKFETGELNLVDSNGKSGWEFALEGLGDAGGLSHRVLDPDTHKITFNRSDKNKEMEEQIAISKALKRVKEERTAGRGFDPSGIERIAQSAVEVKTPWVEHLVTALGTGRSQGKNYKRPKKNRMYLMGNKKPIIPAKGKKTELKIIFAVDTSGSMSDSDLQEAVNQVYSYLKNHSTRMKIHLEIWSCDAAVSKDYVLNEYSTLPEPIKLRGAGGTSFIPVFQEFQKEIKSYHDMKRTTLVYLTDTYGDAQELQAHYPELCKFHTVWLITGGVSKEKAKQNLPFGIRVHLDY